MKVLGVTLDRGLTWSHHISNTVNKLSRLTGGLKFLRNRLTMEQFVKVMTSQYYGTGYYTCQAWLGPHTRKSDLKKLEGMHYKLLRVTVRDWKNRVSRSRLDEIGRAKPSTWGNYAVASIIIKTLRDKVPSRLHDHLTKTMYNTRRNNGIIHFYDDSRRKVGKQAVGNRLKEIFEQLNAPLTLHESNGSIRKMLKEAFGMNKTTVNPNMNLVVPSEKNPPRLEEIPTHDNVIGDNVPDNVQNDGKRK
jgi:hypothetical protein